MAARYSIRPRAGTRSLALPGAGEHGVWELTRPVLVQSCQLPQPFHGDPADQILVATARHHGAILVTKDQRIRRYLHVQSFW